jgi:AhpD family alkylhydroperoxidase
MTPNIMRTMANAPAVLEAYLAFNRALGAGSLTPETREAIALTAAGLNGCDYCAAVHTAGGRALGLADEELARNRDGGSADPGRAAALALATAIVEKR